jgi:hypothetical protein
MESLHGVHFGVLENVDKGSVDVEQVDTTTGLAHGKVLVVAG